MEHIWHVDLTAVEKKCFFNEPIYLNIGGFPVESYEFVKSDPAGLIRPYGGPNLAHGPHFVQPWSREMFHSLVQKHL